MLTHSTIKIQKSSQNLTSDTGLLLINKYLDQNNTCSLFDDIRFQDSRDCPTYSNSSLLRFKLVNLLLGYDSQILQAKAIDDTLFKTTSLVPSQPTISRLFSRVDAETISSMDSLIATHIKHKINALDTIILDADSTNIVCHGAQDGAKHNSHYNNHGFHPLIITEANTNLVLKADLRPGNKQCADGLEEQLEFLFDNFDFENKRVMFRADSQFSNSTKLDLYDYYGLDYAVKAMKRNKPLGRTIVDMAREIMNIKLNESTVYGKLEFSSAKYEAINVSFKAEKIENEAVQGQLQLFDNSEIEYQIIFSNIDLDAEGIFDFYNKRGCSENIFKELKQDFGMGKLSHTNFIQNEFDFLFSCFAYNVYKLMIQRVKQDDPGITLSLFIRKYLKFASKVVFHARQIIVKVDASYRYLDEFMSLYEHI